MYTIKQAASRAGVSVALLRAWERRYGVVQPARTPARYRLYDDASIARLRAMRQLIDDGWSASAAAAHIRDADEPTVAAIVGPAAVSARAREQATDPSSERLISAFVDAAAALDEQVLETLVDEMLSRGSFEHVASDLLMPGLVALGKAWSAGRCPVAAEHAASNAVLRHLGAAFLAAGRPPTGPGVVLVGLPPGARHELGALTFAIAARRAGLPVLYLGTDLPIADWLEAADRTAAAAAVLGVVTNDDVEPATRTARALRTAHPAIVVALGGNAADKVKITGTSPALLLPSDVEEAVAALRDALVKKVPRTVSA